MRLGLGQVNIQNCFNAPKFKGGRMKNKNFTEFMISYIFKTLKYISKTQKLQQCKRNVTEMDV